jgi:DNA-directed RNA polymerase specialized sigma24 family protein
LALGDPESLPDDRDPFEILSQREAGRVVRTLLGKLSEKHARAFVMAELEGMTAEEIAARTYANVSTVHSRIRNARLQIARHAASFRQRDLRGLPSKPAGARSEAQPLRYDSAGAARDSFASEALS